MPEVGEVIKDIREQQGLSQRYVADCCGISHHTVRRIENQSNGSLKHIEAVLEMLGYELEIVPIYGEHTWE